MRRNRISMLTDRPDVPRTHCWALETPKWGLGGGGGGDPRARLQFKRQLF